MEQINQPLQHQRRTRPLELEEAAFEAEAAEAGSAAHSHRSPRLQFKKRQRTSIGDNIEMPAVTHRTSMDIQQAPQPRQRQPQPQPGPQSQTEPLPHSLGHAEQVPNATATAAAALPAAASTPSILAPFSHRREPDVASQEPRSTFGCKRTVEAEDAGILMANWSALMVDETHFRNAVKDSTADEIHLLVQQTVDVLFKSSDWRTVVFGLNVCQKIEQQSSVADTTGLWIPSALELLDSPLVEVRLQSVLALAGSSQAAQALASKQKGRVYSVARSVLLPFDTPAKRTAGARLYYWILLQRPRFAVRALQALLLLCVQQNDQPDSLLTVLSRLNWAHQRMGTSLPPTGGFLSAVVLLLRHADAQLSLGASELAISVMKQHPIAVPQLIQRGLLTLAVLRPMLTHAHPLARDRFLSILYELQATVVTLPLMDDAAFLPLLLATMKPNSASVHDLMAFLRRYIIAATPAQRLLFLSARVIPHLLKQLDFSHAAVTDPGSHSLRLNMTVLAAFVSVMEWEECTVQATELHASSLQLSQSGWLPRLEEIVQAPTPVGSYLTVSLQIGIAQLLRSHVYDRVPQGLTLMLLQRRLHSYSMLNQQTCGAPEPHWFAKRFSDLQQQKADERHAEQMQQQQDLEDEPEEEEQEENSSSEDDRSASSVETNPDRP